MQNLPEGRAHLLQALEQHRSFLLTFAYKMTRSVADAEDILQELNLTILEREIEDIDNARAYLTRAVYNRCLNAIKNRSLLPYKGIDLPEPVTELKVYFDVEKDISFATLLLLQKLNPKERAVFILKTSFDMDYAEIASLLDISELNARQSLHRAKEKVAGGKSKFFYTVQESKAFAETFLKAAQSGDLQQLIHLLKEDIILYPDGGGKVVAALNPIYGREQVMAMLMGMYKKWGAGLKMEPSVANGQPALVIYDIQNGTVDSCIVMDINEGQLVSLYMVRNPDKISCFVTNRT